MQRRKVLWDYDERGACSPAADGSGSAAWRMLGRNFPIHEFGLCSAS